MNTKIFVALLLAVCFISCKKKKDSTTPPAEDTYSSTSAGSTWNYRQSDASGGTPVETLYTLTSTSRDSTINGRSYHVYTNSTSGNEYLTIAGNDYYQFDSLPTGLGTTVFERLYLKDNVSVGTQWTQSLSVSIPGSPIPIPVTVTNQIAEKGISKTVGSNTYTEVIHVSTSISSPLIPAASLTTNIDSYYAKKYGLIQNNTLVHLDYFGITADVNIETTLISATIL